MRYLAIAITAAAVALASPAAAQDRPQRANLSTDQKCEARDGLTLCNGGRAAHAKGKQAEVTGKLTAFTRLAGMFMGRVDAADVGAFRFRFKLEIR